jgi:decaprenyl-phosphate phosphoribosyltransferase
MHRLGLYLQLGRPHQYVKNGFIFLPLFFGYKLGDLEVLPRVFLAFGSFCLAASSVYVINDILDVAEDRQHPVKRLRPLASGALNTAQALLFLLFLVLVSLTTALILASKGFLLILCAYFVLNLAYSYFLKHIAIVDVVCISVGFVLRVAAGGVVADVPISHWIITMTFLLAIFLAFAKRRDDCLMSVAGRNTRKCSDSYNMEFVSTSMAVMASVIIVAYLLYTVSPETIQKHGTDQLYLTGAWVIIGLLRYLQITFVEERSGSPTKLFLQDYFLQIVIFLWIASFLLLLHYSKYLGNLL